jgi:hypothetical protein
VDLINLSARSSGSLRSSGSDTKPMTHSVFLVTFRRHKPGGSSSSHSPEGHANVRKDKASLIDKDEIEVGSQGWTFLKHLWNEFGYIVW